MGDPTRRQRQSIIPPQELTLDATIERLLLDAQLVAHSTEYNRRALHNRAQVDELRIVVQEIGDRLQERGLGVLQFLGLKLGHCGDERVEIHSANATLRIEARDDRRIWVGDRPVKTRTQIYSDRLYRSVVEEITAWALAQAGNDRELWSE